MRRRGWEPARLPEALSAAVRASAAKTLDLEPTPIDGVNSALMDIDPADPRGDLLTFFERARDKTAQKIGVRYAAVSDRLRLTASRMGLAIDETYNHTITAQHYRHIMANHGDPLEAARRGHDPVTDDDLSRLAEIANDFDDMRRTVTNDGHDAISYLRRDESGAVFYVEEVRTGRKALSLKTFMVWRGGKGPKSIDGVPGRSGRSPGGGAKTRSSGHSDGNAASNRLLDDDPQPTAKPGLPAQYTENTPSAARSQGPKSIDDAPRLDGRRKKTPRRTHRGGWASRGLQR